MLGFNQVMVDVDGSLCCGRTVSLLAGVLVACVATAEAAAPVLKSCRETMSANEIPGLAEVAASTLKYAGSPGGGKASSSMVSSIGVLP
jgi:hypothetical protein